MSRSRIALAFESQAARVGAAPRWTTIAAACVDAIAILRDAGCQSVALAAALPQRTAFVEALGAAGLSRVSTSSLSPIRRADAGISYGRLGVAETGSVLLHSTPEDRRVELCVDVHLVVLAADTLVATLDAAFTALRAIAARPPAYASLVSGPSRSADIERQLTIGVHGPRALHILLLEDRP